MDAVLSVVMVGLFLAIVVGVVYKVTVQKRGSLMELLPIPEPVGGRAERREQMHEDAPTFSASGWQLRYEQLQDKYVTLLKAFEVLRRERFGVSAHGLTPLLNPPEGVAAVCRERTSKANGDPYAFVLGWVQTADGSASSVGGSFHGDSPVAVNHLTIGGETNTGKDNLVAGVVLPLLMANSPEKVQFVILDGKRPDGALFRGAAHMWVEPCFTEDAANLMLALQAERRRRERLIADECKVLKWEDLPTAQRPPLLIVYLSEVRVLQSVKGFEEWLAEEMSTARAAGIRYLVGVQSFNNLSTSWRDQAGTKCSAYVANERQVEPALGLTSNEIRARGGVTWSSAGASPCETAIPW
jgi:hypothetical protein